MQTVAISAGGFYDENASSAPRAFELAHAVGAEIVVACVSPRALPQLSRSMPEGLTLCIENHWDQLMRRPGDVLSLVARAPTTRLAACLDTGHAILAGVDPERFATGLASSLAHIHLKDASRPSPVEVALGPRLRRRLRPRPQPVAAGTGDLDVARLPSGARPARLPGMDHGRGRRRRCRIRSHGPQGGVAHCAGAECG